MALISSPSPSPSPTKQAKEGTSTLPFSLNQPTLTTNPFFSQHTQTDNSLTSMEKPRLETQQILSPSSSGRRRSSSSYSSRSNDLNSPEFEFWMVRNPSFPAPNLLSADELFVDGVILPLCLISNQSNDPTDEEEEEEEQEQEQDNHSKDPQTPNLELKQTQQQNPEPETVAEEVPPARGGAEPGPGPEPSTVFSSSKRWRDIFKVGEKKNGSTHEERGEKEKKKDRKSSSSNGGSSAGTELNINIWPFSRSRSAGNSGNRPKMGGGAAVTRKVSSAPCSRSNSRGESKSKKWPTSPSRGIGVGGGIHLGRSSPVWQVRRGGVAAAAATTAVGGGGSGLKTSEPVTVPPPMVVRKEEKAVKKEGVDSRWSKSRFSGGGTGSISGGLNLNLNVPMCMGARQNSCCRSEENSKLVGGGGVEESSSGGGGGVNGGNGGKLFNLRTLFSKKSVVLSN